ncbi:hypothetical protein P280DRAFT_542507 [Massarina eburnea CBS 473.64]|uniref:Jacalin-type lectin domain-containing protein n=1 Tax=Massarina eburnea CBS 473.64 TaxID=1395130 RepID=A0A6A6S0D0_9PLEO|nr:hypothetical protein P280DRAFT_542507 [Massarina eburnea CBS 473.64]
MPSFLSSLRRKSRANVKTDEPRPASAFTKSGANGTNGHSNGGVSRRKSSSTLNSSAVGSSSTSTTPATSTSGDVSVKPNGLKNGVPPLPSSRPQRPGPNPTKRYSMNVRTHGPPCVQQLTNIQGSASNAGWQSATNPSSLLAPRILSITENSWVHQQVLLIFGQIGDPSHPLDGTVTVNHHQSRFPPTAWPVCDSYFKALIHLEPGWNRLRLDFSSPKISPSNGSISPHASFLNVNYLALTNTPPLQLAIILGRDSAGTYDATPERIQREGNGLELAIKKYRMAAYLWQAFTGEQMNRQGMGRRCFRFEESWEPGTLSYQDWESGQFRNQAKIHIIRSDKTVEEIRDLDRAQQHGPGTKKGELFDIASEAVKKHFQMQPGRTQYVSCLILDSHWDGSTIRGHAALGGGDGNLQLAICGSHALQSYPSSIEEVWQAFGDCTRTDTAHVANDCNESGSNWEAANIGIGAHMHETGHLFGCPHQENGVMLRDYVTLNRTFTCREPYSTRTKSPGKRLVLPNDECGWHVLDLLRFRFHPCFRIPIDFNTTGDGSVQVWTVDIAQGGVIATSKSGIAWVEIFTEGDDTCHYWKRWPEVEGQYPRQVALNEQELRDLMPREKAKSKLKIEVFSAGGGSHTVENLAELANQNARVRLPDGRFGFRGSKLGYSSMEGSQPHEIIFESAISTKLLVTVRIYAGACVDGLEFIYEDSTTQLFGKRGGEPHDFLLDVRRGEHLMGFALRTGLWVDAVQVLTTLGRKSEMYGNKNGGSGHTLIPPRGYTIGGLSGSCGPWLDGFSLVIVR